MTVLYHRERKGGLGPGLRHSAGDEGLALVEAIVVSVVFIVPLMAVLGVLSELQRGALAASAAAREAGFEAARSDNAAQADRAVEAAVDAAFSDHGIDSQSADVRWTGAPGWQRGGVIEIEVSYPVRVLQLPFLGSVSEPSVWVNARHIARIDPYMSRG
ncbi:MAG: hypothetical protein H0T12_09315 [Actinobacteria bacterium]|nr:hypothetical protein [Actinomycetota bacterium]